MKQPEGFPQGSEDEVLQLKKGIYGTKQSPRLWHQKLDSVLSTMGFEKVQSDNALCVRLCDSDSAVQSSVGLCQSCVRLCHGCVCWVRVTKGGKSLMDWGEGSCLIYMMGLCLHRN